MNFSRKVMGLVAALGVAFSLAGCGINDIPAKDQAVKAQWANVQAAYQRRADLIPNLVNTVQGYANQEKSVLVEVTQARAQATHVSIDASTVNDPAKFAEFQQAQDKLSGVLGRLMSINEQYPDLKSDENFLALQSQLEGTENRIAVARRDYNDSVQSYNTELVTFPGVLWKGTMYKDYKPMNLFSASSQAQSAPTVNFNIAAPQGASSAPAAAPGSAPPK